MFYLRQYINYRSEQTKTLITWESEGFPQEYNGWFVKLTGLKPASKIKKEQKLCFHIPTRPRGAMLNSHKNQFIFLSLLWNVDVQLLLYNNDSHFSWYLLYISLFIYFFPWKPEGKKPLGRQRRTRIHNVKMDIR
jgi:hypothetical protein